MFDELEKYKSNDHFFFRSGDKLEEVCNAPKKGIGVFVIYMLKNGRVELVYIGSAGKVNQDGTPNARTAGLYESLVHGEQFGKARNISWKNKLNQENIDALDVYWYETFDKNQENIPSSIKGIIMQRYFDVYGNLPAWNEEF